MDQDFDDVDLRSLSDRISPIASTLSTNRSSSRQNKTMRKTTLSNPYEEHRSLPDNPNIGDIIQLNDGTRKKFNGTSWRRLCSQVNCNYYTQNSGFCKPHYAKLKEQKLFAQSNYSNSHNNIDDIEGLHDERNETNHEQEYSNIYADSTYIRTNEKNEASQNEQRSKSNEESHVKILLRLKSPSKTLHCPSTSTTTPSSRKRQRPNSPSSFIPSQVPVLSNIQSSTSKSNRRVSIAVIPPSVDINNPKKGDIIKMENGSYKKFDGVVWRKICSIPGCLIAAQRDELCRKHYIKLNGKPNNESVTDMLNSVTMVKPSSKRMSSMSASSNEEKSEFSNVKQIKHEFMDYDTEHDDINNDFTLNSYNASDDNNTNTYENNVSIIEDNISTTLNHASSSNRQRFETNLLKQWLDEHRDNPYPNNQEKLQLAKQSSITIDQVTTWFNNARAILRRCQTKLENTFTNIDNHDSNNEYFSSNPNLSYNTDQSSPIFNDVCYRSIGIQCNPSTASQITSTSTTMTDDDIKSDRTIKILTPSANVLKLIDSLKANHSQNKDDHHLKINENIIVTSTCLDDNQMNRLKEFCSRFDINISNIVDEHTTHLITDEEKGDTLVCPLSKKVIQAVARHMYIVTYRWIDACLNTNKIINEKPYEIQGDLTLSFDHNGMQRSRQSISSKHLLFENYSIMLKCDGCQNMMNNDELIELVQLSGAKHTTDSHFSRLEKGIKRIVLCEKEYLINRQEMYEKCIHAGIHFVTPEWFLESLVQYRIQPFHEYELSP